MQTKRERQLKVLSKLEKELLEEEIKYEHYQKITAYFVLPPYKLVYLRGQIKTLKHKLNLN